MIAGILLVLFQLQTSFEGFSFFVCTLCHMKWYSYEYRYELLKVLIFIFVLLILSCSEWELNCMQMTSRVFIPPSLLLPLTPSLSVSYLPLSPVALVKITHSFRFIFESVWWHHHRRVKESARTRQVFYIYICAISAVGMRAVVKSTARNVRYCQLLNLGIIPWPRPNFVWLCVRPRVC